MGNILKSSDPDSHKIAVEYGFGMAIPFVLENEAYPSRFSKSNLRKVISEEQWFKLCRSLKDSLLLGCNEQILEIRK